MMLFKRLLSITLSSILVTSVALPAISLDSLAATGDPWNDTAAWPSLTAKNTLIPGTTYFTGKEWTGEKNSKDIGGNTVNQADVFGVNREDGHSANIIPYDSVEKARIGAINFAPENSNYYQLLTGENQNWDLSVYKSPALADAAGITNDFYKTDYDASEDPYTGKNKVSKYSEADYDCGWKSVTLPASWQTQGFDFPIYTNITIPWLGAYGNSGGDSSAAIPLAPTTTNPVGFYRRTFDVKPEMMANNQKVYISFQGVESAMYLYVNGNEVGYTEDSFDAHDFDITPFLNPGGKDNVLAVRVHRWSDGSWLEDQDFLRLSGIYRDVYLYSTPLVQIRDYKVETDFDSNYVNADLNLSLEVANNSTTDISNYGVDVKLFDKEGTDIFAASPLRGDVPAITSEGQVSVPLTKNVLKPHQWSDENPYLYTLVISLYDKTTKKYFSSISQQLGFREIEFTMTEVDANYNRTTQSYKQITINGKPLLFRGTNRHDTSFETGRYVTKDLFETDIELMKQNNINSVRTSHYPGDSYLYYLCDKYGLYVMSEANIEFHALSDKSDLVASHFTAAVRDRHALNVHAQKNSTSVVMWSLGNESGNTPNSKMFQKSIQEVIRPIDSTRPIHYEGLYDQGGVDVASNMYPGFDWIESNGKREDRMPYVLCEYNHTRGNTLGSTDEFWNIIRGYDNMLGGFIWDWVDQSIATPIDEQLIETKVNADLSENDFIGELTGDISADSGSFNGKSMTGYTVIPAKDNDNANIINSALSGNNPFTMEMWVNQYGTSQGYNSLITKGDNQVALRSAPRGNGWILTYYVKTNKGEWIQADYDAPSNWVGNWHHIAAIFDGRYLTLYCDGQMLTPEAGDNNDIGADASIATSTHDFAVSFETETARTADNKVAVARVYNKALTKTQLDAQGAADLAGTDHEIAPDSNDVVVWLDFSKAKIDLSDVGYWDYYAEQGIDNMSGKFYGYGGSWEDSPNSKLEACNGLVNTDRTPQPKLQQLKYVYQAAWYNTDTASMLKREVEVYNEFNFTDLSAYDIKWELLEDGKTVDSGILDLNLAPGDRKTVQIPFTMPETLKADGEYFINLTTCLKDDTLWADKGYAVSNEQFRVPATITAAPAIDTTKVSDITKTETDSEVTITGDKFTLKFDKAKGTISSYVYDGVTVLTAGPTPNYWRAPTDGDQRMDSTWKDANVGTKVKTLTVGPSNDGKTIEVDVVLELPNAKNSTQKTTYIIYGSGEIKVKATLNPNDKMGELLKYGAELTLPKSFENITWYGDGPKETYQDRKLGSTVGVFESTVSDSFFPFIHPQNSGNKTGVRYIALEDPAQPVGVMVVGAKELESGALHFNAKELSGKRYTYQLPKTDHTVLNVDYGSRGVGNESLGPSPLTQYRLLNDGRDYTYEYTIVPYLTASANKMELSKLWRDAESFDLDEFNNQEANRVEALIQKVSVLLSNKQKADIETARAEYNKLTDGQKALVSNYKVLTAAEAEINRYKNAKAFVKDKSANKLDGEITETGSIKIDPTSPTGYSLNGFFQVPDTSLVNSKISGNNPFSLEIWVKPYDYDDGNTFITKGDTQTSLKVSSGKLEFCIFDGNWQQLLADVPNGWGINEWHHIVTTYDGSSIKIYGDGELLSSKAVSTSVRTNDHPLGIGNCYDRDRPMRGEIAEAVVYTKALSEKEVADRFSGKSTIAQNDSSVLVWYDMKDAYATDVLKYAMGDVNNDGTITVTDIVALRKIIMSDDSPTAGQMEVCDLNKDESLTVTDIVALRKLIMKD